jgi:hypothetical protein
VCEDFQSRKGRGGSFDWRDFSGGMTLKKQIFSMDPKKIF